MARPSKRNIAWHNFKRNPRSQAKGLLDAFRFVGMTDDQIREQLEAMRKESKETSKERVEQ
jgi:hypothetical protein